MSLTLYSHPFASYCQKVLIALWENEVPFTYRHLEEPGAAEERAALWPLGRFPVLVDDGRTIAESSIIIEHLDLHHTGPVQLLPRDRDAALEVRFMDRFFDNYVMTAMQKPVSEALRAEATRKEEAMAEARQALDTAYAWLEERLSGRTYAAGENFFGRMRALAQRGPPFWALESYYLCISLGFVGAAPGAAGVASFPRSYADGVRGLLVREGSAGRIAPNAIPIERHRARRRPFPIALSAAVACAIVCLLGLVGLQLSLGSVIERAARDLGAAPPHRAPASPGGGP